MKGFIEVTIDINAKIYISVSSIWSIGVESNGMVGIYTIPTLPKHFEVIESIDEIAAKIEAATEHPKKVKKTDTANIYYDSFIKEPCEEDYDSTGCLFVSHDGRQWNITTKKYVYEYPYWAPTPKKEIGP